MRVIQLSAKPDADGVIRVSIPVGAGGGEYDLAVVLQPRPPAPAPAKPGARTPEELGWPPGYFENVIGSIDDETFMAPPRGPARPVPPLGEE